MDIGEYYRDKQNCFNDLIELRKAWGFLTFGLPQAKQAWKTLNIMWLHCPKEAEVLIGATRDEFIRRMELMGIEGYGTTMDLGIGS